MKGEEVSKVQFRTSSSTTAPQSTPLFSTITTGLRYYSAHIAENDISIRTNMVFIRINNLLYLKSPNRIAICRCSRHSSHTHQTSGLVLRIVQCVCVWERESERETLRKSCDVSILACFHVDVCFNPQGQQWHTMTVDTHRHTCPCTHHNSHTHPCTCLSLWGLL